MVILVINGRAVLFGVFLLGDLVCLGGFAWAFVSLARQHYPSKRRDLLLLALLLCFALAMTSWCAYQLLHV